jgi:hypothetical protein
VRAQYHERFIPQAIETGEHFYAEDAEHPAFVWTTGAWLIWDHLNSQPQERVKRLERAIERGLIRWHALPFTTHSELMSPDLFRAGLSFGEELDRRFGMKTTAAKMTDVPGHTRGIVPLLAAAGVKFLHLGVNSASPVPGVPDVFRWRAPDGAEILVMYQPSYGETHFPQGFAEGLSFAHTNDNAGPQTVPQTVDAYRALRHQHPDAEIRASTLDAYGELLWARREAFPVVEHEIGDSWIYGSASDPIKTQLFLAMQRLYDGFVVDGLTPERHAFGRGLTLVAEHTCGVDIKSYLRDERAWDRPAFEAARKNDYRFAFAERSWAEQREYLEAALSELDPVDRKRAEAEIAGLAPSKGRTPVTTARSDTLTVGGWTVGFDAAIGDVTSITSPSGKRIGGDGMRIGFRYESYDHHDVAAWLDTYLTHREEWAILDHGKPGLENAATAHSALCVPKLSGRAGDALAMTLDEEAQRDLGAPARVLLEFRAIDDTRAELVVTLRDKPANRMPEASFLDIALPNLNWEFRKMGLWQPADKIAARGGGELQAVTGVRATLSNGGTLEIMPLDTPLVAPLGAPFMVFNPAPPDYSAGLRFNLHNNKWGTNFPMWWEGNLRARFVLALS